MFRLLIAGLLAFVVLAGVARGQEFAPSIVAMAIANDIDAVTVDCPVVLDPPAACFRYSLDSDWLKMKLESFVRDYNDIEWGIPWRQEDTILVRALRLDNGDAYFVYIMNDGNGSIGFVQWIVTE